MADKPRPMGRPPNDDSGLPLPTMIDKRWVWPRAEVETLRLILGGKAAKPTKAPKGGGDLVTISELAAELGLARRTVTRRVDEARAAKAVAGEPGKAGQR